MKCFITKFPEVISNKDLPYFGALKLKVTKGERVQLNLQPYSGNIDVYKDNGELFYSFSENNNDYPSYTPTEDGYLIVKNKYNLKTLPLALEINNTSGYSLNCSLQEIKYCSHIKRIEGYFTGNINEIAGLDELESIIDAGNQVYGNIEDISNLHLENMQAVLGYNRITGDMSRAPHGANYMLLMNNKNRVFSWETERSSDEPIITFKEIHFDKYLDAMLINMAKMSVDNTSTDKNISVCGDRTTASDAAISTLQNKGYTISILN